MYFAKSFSREVKRKKPMFQEAKKMRAFLEDYDDERDDPKYYKWVFS